MMETYQNMDNNTGTTENDNVQYGLAGFVNMGNTCYLNSVLQMLSNIPLFREYFINKSYHLQIIENIRNKSTDLENFDNIDVLTDNMKNTISFQLERLLKAIWKTKNNEIPTYKPTSFRRLIAKKYDSFNNHGQQDAAECITAVFNLIKQDIEYQIEVVPNITDNEQTIYSLFDEYNEKLDDDKVNNNLKIDIRLLLRELEEKFVGYMKRYSQLINLRQRYAKEYSLIDELFSIGNISTITCSNCDYKRYIYGSEDTIIVEMPTDIPTEEEIKKKMSTIVFPFELKQHMNFNIKKQNSNDKIHQTVKLSSLFDLESETEKNDSDIYQTEYDILSDNNESTTSEDLDDFDKFLDDDDELTFEQPKNNFNFSNDVLENMRRTKAIQELVSEREYSLEHCLDLYFRNDTIECKCNFCGENKENTKCITLLNIPKYLIIHLKRFDYDWVREQGVKKTQFIKYGHELDISKYIDDDLLDHLKTNTKYNLINVINHYGVYGAGHYYAYCKNSCDDTWYCFNDETVTPVSNIITQNAYVLVYEKQNY